MTIQEAIELAVKGGWEIRSIIRGRATVEGSYAVIKTSDGEWVSESRIKLSELNVPSTFLDPSFWESLSRALEWDDYADFCSNCREFKGKSFDCPMNHCTCPEKAWIYYWHRFVDHLAGLGTPESFFSSLPVPPQSPTSKHE